MKPKNLFDKELISDSISRVVSVICKIAQRKSVYEVSFRDLGFVDSLTLNKIVTELYFFEYQPTLSQTIKIIEKYNTKISDYDNCDSFEKMLYYNIIHKCVNMFRVLDYQYKELVKVEDEN